MQPRLLMGFSPNYIKRIRFALVGLVVCLPLLSGCISYRFLQQIQGVEIKDPGDCFAPGKTILEDVLPVLGAPTHVMLLEGQDLLIYERSVSHENKISVGIPVFDIAVGGSADFSASGALTRYDTLALFFSPDGVLDHMVYEKGSDLPYFKTLFSR